MEKFTLFLMWADIVLLLYIGTRVIRLDSPTKPGAFWLALPVSKMRMMWSKVWFLGLFCWAPAVL